MCRWDRTRDAGNLWGARAAHVNAKAKEVKTWDWIFIHILSNEFGAFARPLTCLPLPFSFWNFMPPLSINAINCSPPMLLIAFSLTLFNSIPLYFCVPVFIYLFIYFYRLFRWHRVSDNIINFFILFKTQIIIFLHVIFKWSNDFAFLLTWLLDHHN